MIPPSRAMGLVEFLESSEAKAALRIHIHIHTNIHTHTHTYTHIHTTTLSRFIILFIVITPFNLFLLRLGLFCRSHFLMSSFRNLILFFYFLLFFVFVSQRPGIQEIQTCTTIFGVGPHRPIQGSTQTKTNRSCPRRRRRCCCCEERGTGERE